MLLRRGVLVWLLFLFCAGIVLGIEAIPNWSAPGAWSPTRGQGVHTLADATPPRPFIGLPPCRLVDTRGTAGVPINTGGAFAANEMRTWVFTGLCGIPASADAVSLNITVTGTGGQTAFGFITIWPGGGTEPNVSTLNWSTAGVTESNAAVVPFGTSPAGSVSVRSANNSAQVLVDTNGYYGNTPATTSNYFSVFTSAPFAIYGFTNSPVGTGVYGTNNGSGNGVWGENDSPNDGAAGVFGRVAAGIGATTGVWGRTQSTTTNAAGVYGDTRGTAGGPTSGIIYGVLGFTRSLDAGSAGVGGADRSGDPGQSSFDASAGVAGESFSGYGVFGISRSGVGKAGVKGVLTQTDGTALTAGWLGYNATDGVHALGNISATGTKPFIDPHPTDPSKEIAYVALEGPEAGTYFRGRATIHSGVGTIVVPESFRIVTDDDGLTVQITPIGQVANVAVVSADLNTVVVRSSVRELEFYYVVNGMRRAYKDWNPVPENAHYIPSGPTATMPAILAPEQRRALIASGIYNEDGTVNLQTAERLGWVKAWKDREERLRSASADQRFRLDKE